MAATSATFFSMVMTQRNAPAMTSSTTYPDLPSFSLDSHGSTDFFPLPQYCSTYHMEPSGRSCHTPLGCPKGTSNDFGFSGFFTKDAADCRLTTNCVGEGEEKLENRLTSLMDLRMRALAYENTLLDFVQLGMEDDGMTRVYPYQHKSYGNPSKCYNDDEEAWDLSYCHDCSTSTGSSLPAYDSRCRSWYGTAKRGGDPDKVYFQKPRVASSGKTVVTAVVPIKEDVSAGNALLGVLNLNVEADLLSDSVNVSTQTRSLGSIKRRNVF